MSNLNLDPQAIYRYEPPQTGEDYCRGVLSAAQHYASKGIPVFPCQSIRRDGAQYLCTCGRPDCAHPGKHPLTPRGHKDATRDPEQINRWWAQNPNANIGLVMGADSGLVVVDVDPRNGGDVSWARIAEEHPLPKDTLIANTGGGGLHVFVEYPTGNNGRKLPARIAQGIDFRYKGYVIAAPGLHVTGGMYTWKEGSKPAPWSWLEPQLKGLPVLLKADEGERRVAEGALLDALAHVRRAQEGERNNILYKEAYSIGGLVAGGLLDRERVALDFAENAIYLCGKGFPQEEYNRTVDHGLDEGAKKPRYTVFGRSANPIDDDDADSDPILLDVQGPGIDWKERSLARRQLNQIEAVSEGKVVYDRGQLYGYNQDRHHWEPLPPHLLRLHLAWHNTYDEKRKKFLDISKHKSDEIIGCCEQEREQPGFFDTRAPGVVCSNGRWNEGELHPHSPDDRVLFALDVPWDPAAECPLYDAFLDRVVPDKACQQILNEFAGAALLGITHLYKAALALTGPGNNGKSQWLNILSGFFPSASIAAAPLHSLEHEYYRADIAGKAINIVNEISDKDLYDTGQLKGMIAGDRTKGRHPAGRSFDFLCRTGFVFATNSLPPIHDKSDGFWSRFYVVGFEVTIPKDERIIDYGRKILESEAPGILRRFLEAAQELIQRGQLTESPKAEKTKKGWRQQTDPLDRFLDGLTYHEDRSQWTRGSDLRAALARWCYEEGVIRIPTPRELGLALTKRGFPSKDMRIGITTGRVYFVSVSQDTTTTE